MNLIGLAMRAGKLITGEELTIAEIRKQKQNWCLWQPMQARIQEKDKR